MTDYANKISMGSVAIGISSLISIVSAIAIVPLFIRAVGVESYGLFLVLTAVVGFMQLGELGISGAVANQISYFWAEKKQKEISELLSGAIVLFGGLFVGVLLIIGAVFMLDVVSVQLLFGIDPMLASLARASFFLLLLFSAVNLFVSSTIIPLFKGMNEVARYHLAQSWYVGFYSISFVLFLWYTPTLIHIILFQGLWTLFRTVFLFVYARRRFSWIKISLRVRYLSSIRPLLGYSAMFFILRFGNTFINKTDMLVISHVLGVGAATPFSIADRIFRLPTGMVQVAAAAEPSIASAYKLKDTLRLEQLYRQVLRMNMLFKAAPLLFVLIYSQDIIRFWIGPSFFLGYKFTSLFFLSYMIYAWVGPHFAFINSMFRHRAEILPMLINVIINVIVSVLGAIHFGLIGIILGTVLGNLLTNGWYLPLYLKRFINVHPLKELSRIIGTLLLPCAVALLSHVVVVSFFSTVVPFIFATVVSGCVYLAVMYQFALEKQERVFVRNKVVGIYSRVIRTQGV